MRSFAKTAQDDRGESMILRKTTQDGEITLNKPCIYQYFLKIANLRPIDAHLEKNRVNIPAKCVRGPYFRAYVNCHKPCIYQYFLKIVLKLSI